MQKYGLKIIMIVVMLGVVADIAGAQNTQRLRNDFRKLEQYVMRVASLVQNLQDDQARQFVEKAFENLEQARRYLFDVSPPRLTLARFNMVAAKANADRAAKLILLKPLAYLKSQLDDQINRAERAVARSGSDETHYLLNQAKKYRTFSYGAFQRGNLARGQEYYRISYFFAQKCIEFFSNAGKDLPTQISDLELSIRQLLVEAEELVRNSDNLQLQNLLEDANRYFEQALEFAENGQYTTAFKRLQLIKRLLYRIFDMVDRGDTNIENRLENNLYSLRSLLESISSEVEDSDIPQLKTLLQKAWEVYQQAQQSFDLRQYDQVKPKIAIAQRLANRILQLNKRKPEDNLTALRQRAEETSRLLERLAQDDNLIQRAQLRTMFEEANRLLDLALQTIDLNRPGRAFQLIQLATRITARLQREIIRDQADFQEAELRKTYQRIQNMLRRLRESGEVPDRFMVIIDQLSDFADQGKLYLDQGLLVLADEYFSTIIVQIKQLTSRWKE